MGVEELVGAAAQAVVVDRLGDGVCPSCSESGVELLGAAVNVACAFGSVEQAGPCLLGSVAAVQNPCDAEVLEVADAAGEGGAGLPRVGQLVVVTSKGWQRCSISDRAWRVSIRRRVSLSEGLGEVGEGYRSGCFRPSRRSAAVHGGGPRGRGAAKRGR